MNFIRGIFSGNRIPRPELALILRIDLQLRPTAKFKQAMRDERMSQFLPEHTQARWGRVTGIIPSTFPPRSAQSQQDHFECTCVLDGCPRSLCTFPEPQRPKCCNAWSTPRHQPPHPLGGGQVINRNRDPYQLSVTPRSIAETVHKPKLTGLSMPTDSSSSHSRSSPPWQTL